MARTQSTLSMSEKNEVKVISEKKPYSFFRKLPASILTHQILPFFDLEKDFKTMGNLARISKDPFFRDLLGKRFQTLLNKMLYHVIYAEKKAVEALLNTVPPPLRLKLLTTPQTVIDYSNRPIHAPALGLALGAEDVNEIAHDNFINEGMAEMLMRFLKKDPQGEIIIQDQIREQFPDGWEEAEEKRKKDDRRALHKVVEAIKKSKKSDYCAQALMEFREHFKPKKVITRGKHFNSSLLAEARYLCNDAATDLLSGRDAHKTVLLLSHVFGYIHRLMPACLGLELCQYLKPRPYHYLRVDRNFNYQCLILASHSDLPPPSRNTAPGVLFPLKPEEGIGYNYTYLTYSADCLAIILSQKEAALTQILPPSPPKSRNCCENEGNFCAVM